MFGISKFLFELKDKLSKSNFYVKAKSLLFNRLQSILLKVLRRVYLSSVNNGKRRKNGLWIQFRDHICVKGFKDSWNLCLNLCLNSLRWLKPGRSGLISSILLLLWELYTDLTAGVVNLRIFFLNVSKFSELRRLGSNLFHSEIADGKKEFLKKLCFDLKMESLCTFLVVYGARLTGSVRLLVFENFIKKTNLSVPASHPKRF